MTSKERTTERSWPARLYVPIATMILVLVTGHWLAALQKDDPLAAAQNPRLKFKTEVATGGTDRNALSDPEIRTAATVLDKNRHIEGDQLKVLYVGNSQTMAIMDAQPSDLTTPQWFQILLSRQSSEEVSRANVILASEANMSMTEVLIKLVAAGEQSPRQCDVLLDSAVLEEYRGLGVREDIAKAAELREVKDKLAVLLRENNDLTAAVNALAPVIAGAGQTAVPNESSNGSIAERLERRLQTLSERNALFARRTDLQVKLYTIFYVGRNAVLRIDSTTPRPVPPYSYKASLELLELALRYALAKGIHVVLYLAPMRPIQPNPNVPGDVSRFRKDMPTLCARYQATCLDYVDVVPEKLWTNYSDEYMGGQRDFAHFTGAAHRLVAEDLMRDLLPKLNLWAQPRKETQP